MARTLKQRRKVKARKDGVKRSTKIHGSAGGPVPLGNSVPIATIFVSGRRKSALGDSNFRR